MREVIGHKSARRILVYGSTGASVHIAFEGIHQAGGRASVVAYVDDTPDAPDVACDGLPVIDFDGMADYPDLPILVAVQSAHGRRSLFERLDEVGRRIIGMPGLAHLVHPLAEVGEGVVVSSTSRVMPGVRLERGVMVLADLVAEDVHVGEYTTLAVHSIVLGHVDIGADVHVAPGAIINNGRVGRRMTIGDGAIIGTGAVVDRPVGAGEVVLGNRAMSPEAWHRLRAL
ncbi:MAG: hypothetical protein Q4G46_16185, partial [Propionibacteriaceae bacterium]|nr:hypothetical protein [Propionibacteriaceae bacterium]